MPKQNNSTAYGPENPHPLSQRKTELVWEGKYDEYGNRRPVKLPTSPLPLQRIETIDEPHDRKHAEAQQLGLPFGEEDFARAAHRDDFRNMLIWGDNKLAMSSLLNDVILSGAKNLGLRGKIDLIYIDPPFDVGADFTMQVQLGDEGDAVQKEQSILEAVAYRDTWGKGTDSYLHMMYERLTLMRDLLSERGSIYVHCDWRMSYYLRTILNEVFGLDAYRNDIVWQKIRVVKAQSSSFGSVHDTIFFYSRTSNNVFNRQVTSHDNEYEKKFDKIEVGTGRRYQLVSLLQAGQGPARKFGTKVLEPGAGRHWIWSQERINQAIGNGLIEFTSGGMPRKKQYLDESEGRVVDDLWLDIFPVNSQALEDTSYATQKPESLLERIIRASSNEGDLVADFFCGSGTTLAVAEKLGRRWIGVDLGRYAVHTSRKRLIQVQRELHDANKPYRSFDVYNLGRYERQWWQLERLKGADENHRELVLQFYKAQNLTPNPFPKREGEKDLLPSPVRRGVGGEVSNPLLHGKKGAAIVHVDQIDSIFSYEELRAVAQAAQATGARELHILAWEFEMELALKKQAIEAETNLTIRLKYIPREIMEPNRAEVQFFEAGALQAKILKTGLTGLGKNKSKNPVNPVNPVEIDIELVNFIPSLAEAPEAELDALRKRAVKSPFDFIDFWAVDFDYRANKPFEHHWQDFRTRKDRSLKTKTEIGWQYKTKGKHHICVKVIDVFGVDTTTVLEVDA